MVHLGSTSMNGVLQCMSHVQNLILERLFLWDNYVILEP
jgi:hypothetical protein